MLLGGWLGARQALEWGLVNRVAPAGTLADALDTMATELASKSRGAAATVKHLVRAATDVELSEGLELERTEVARHMRTADAMEGLAAFVDKRSPRF